MATVKKSTETIDFVILQEFPPSRGRRLVISDQVFADTGLADVDAEFEEFPVDPGGAPRRILFRSFLDRLAGLPGDMPGSPRLIFQVQNSRKPVHVSRSQSVCDNQRRAPVAPYPQPPIPE